MPGPACAGGREGVIDRVAAHGGVVHSGRRINREGALGGHVGAGGIDDLLDPGFAIWSAEFDLHRVVAVQDDEARSSIAFHHRVGGRASGGTVTQGDVCISVANPRSLDAEFGPLAATAFPKHNIDRKRADLSDGKGLLKTLTTRR